MWQAPALTVAAQAFLLQVITDQTVADLTRLVVVIVGVVASFAAIASLL